MKKKLQIFISSTYIDLIDERQAAVEGVLRAGNIPAGMELFSAGNKSQLDTIKKWIAESDIYVLILGGRYGSTEPESKLSYTEIEYHYAIEIGKPFFAIVLSDKMLDAKIKTKGMEAKRVHEFDNQEKYKAFKNLVLSRVCRICDELSEIKLAILESIIDIQNQFELTGWVKGSEIPDNSQLIMELGILRSEKDELQKKITSLESLTQKTSKTKTIGEYDYSEVKKVLQQAKLTIPSNIMKTEKDWDANALKAMLAFRAHLSTGVTTVLSSETQKFLTNKLVPLLLNFGLVERQKVRNAGMKIEYDKFVFSSVGNKFLSLYQIETSKEQSADIEPKPLE